MKRANFLNYLALSALAIAQPLLDLYGRNLTIFSYSKLPPVAVALFVTVVVVLPAVCASVAEAIASRFGSMTQSTVRMLLVRSFLFLFVLALLNTMHVRDDFVAYPLALVGAALIGRLWERSAIVAAFFVWLRILPLVVVGMFVLQAQPVLFPPTATTASATIEHRDIPVIQIIFDEMPLFSLLNSEGVINAERFPGFATLAREATWYRDAVAVSNFTHQAVPAILTSSIPSKKSTPLLADHEKNVFTLLGGVMPVDGIEPVTSLCPMSLCRNAEDERATFRLRRLGGFFRDAAYVYLRRVTPTRSARNLPRVDTGWGGFDLVVARRGDMGLQGFLGQQSKLLDGVRTFVASPTPAYQLVHVLMPHAPWYLTPDGRVQLLTLDNGYTISKSPDAVRDVYQRYLYQAMATDAALTEAIDILKDSGVWDKAMVVVGADHGISFIPGELQRSLDLSDPDAIDDQYRVPMFIKYPHQESGTVSDCPASNLDLLPTIIDVLGVKSKWTFEGESVASACPARPGRPIEAFRGDKELLVGGFERTLARVAHYSSFVDPNGSARAVAAVGASAALIGKPLGALEKSAVMKRWTLNESGMFDIASVNPGSVAPFVAHGGVLLTAPLPAGSEGIIVVDGVAAGVVGEFSLGRKFFTYQSVLDYTLLTRGKHRVTLAIRDGATGRLTDAGPPS